jgi:endonuclease/exonuclease/phosphatase (EEP) superfamily protein YafD
MAQSFRLMTVNLLNGRADAGHLAEILDRLEPHLVLTQEMGPNAAEVIAARYPHHDLQPALDHTGRGIASRFDAEFGSIPLPWRLGSWARVGIGARHLLVAGVHMPNPIDFPWWMSIRRRRDELDALFSWADSTIGDEALVVAGDMNATLRWPVYRRLAERWEDLVVTAAQLSGAETAPTWGWRPGWPLMLRIDHVFGAGVLGVATTVEPVRGSDHAALVVDLELNRTGSARTWSNS